MEIAANRMDRGFYQYQKEYEDKALEVLRSGWYILGKEEASFEESFARYVGVPYCAGLANGLDALWIGCKLLGIGEGDEVLVQGNTYIASVMGISINHATPVFVEPDEYFQLDLTKLEENLTEKTKAVMVVHLYGHMTDMDALVAFCKKHQLYLIEDCAQAHGAKWNGKMAGSFGDVGCFSFYPSKNLGAFGDAGALVSSNPDIIKDAKIFRNYGSEKRYYNKVVGANSRLDELQAGLLNIRLSHMDEITAERQSLASEYSAKIHNPLISCPKTRSGNMPVWHQYVVQSEYRDQLLDYLKENGIASIIHYPIPPHLSEAYGYLGLKEGILPITEHYANTVLSIPMYNGMTAEEQEYVIECLNAFRV
ncbi:MAG: DegT/DnrJ/EryC1/StrS family aminotransferase [Lachnospiraceae bacterium]|nr:DegT/DnrJ/EryC1/StrS family aminotransferase [Lachnospiraceae bacterium]